MTSRPQPSPSPLDPGPHGFAATGSIADDAAVAQDIAHESLVGGEYAGQSLALAPASRREARGAMLAYLGVPFSLFVAPLAVYLVSLHGRAFARAHAVQALNVALATLLYSVCGLIVGGVLAFDSTQVALVVAVPLVAALWLRVLVVLIRAASAASRSELRPIPRWLCLTSGMQPPEVPPGGAPVQDAGGHRPGSGVSR
ncbi:MAG TPA: DUF4870 domain-containing protein [Streptosporangiaceae bacterium]|nr:DUF4870 domain-containing protein [Streptosporangiaceae bacterium]